MHSVAQNNTHYQDIFFTDIENKSNNNYGRKYT